MAALRRLLGGDARYVELGFTVFLLVVAGLLLGLSFTYEPDTRLFPLIAGAPTVVLTLALLSVQASSRVAGLVERTMSSDLFDVTASLGGLAAEEPSTDEDDVLRTRTRLLVMAAWVAGAFVLVLLAGFLVGLLAFLLAFYRRQARLLWPRTVGYALLVWLVIVFIFDFVLNSQLYGGLLGVGPLF